eukprot:m.77121 g.77121  ORF g.77121 m.77121 type:complete len:158 (-) comp8535_c1_seq2:1465-1938(-)
METFHPCSTCISIIAINAHGDVVSSSGNNCNKASNKVHASSPSHLTTPPGVHAPTLSAGKFASAITNSSPCPIFAIAKRSSGGRTAGIPFKIVILPTMNRNYYWCNNNNQSMASFLFTVMELFFNIPPCTIIPPSQSHPPETIMSHVEVVCVCASES